MTLIKEVIKSEENLGVEGNAHSGARVAMLRMCEGRTNAFFI